MRLFLITLGCLVCGHCYAQNEVDLIRLTQYHSFTTTRSAGMGGAFGALGADVSVLSSNPAGLGFYRRGEFSFSGSLDFNSSRTSIYDTETSDLNAAFKVNSIGYSATQDSPKRSIGKSTFTIGYNRLASYNESFTQELTNDDSLLENFRDQVQGLSVDEIYEYEAIASMAWDAYLIDPDTTTAFSNDYVTAIPFGNTDQRTEVTRKGGMGEIVLGTGAGSSNSFYWGVALGIPIMNFEETFTHTETPKEDDLDLESFTYTERLNIDGAGVNLKAGVMLRPTKWLRLGGAVHTGTRFGLTDNYSYYIDSRFKDGAEFTPDSIVGLYEYRINTPARFFLNSAVIIGKHALVAMDYEQVKYSNGSISSASNDANSYDFAAENDAISGSLRKVHHLKIGAEYRLNNSYRLRAGFRYLQNAYLPGSAAEIYNQPLVNFTAGAGYRHEHFFTDGALDYSRNRKGFTAYSNYIDQSDLRHNLIRVNVSVGWRF